MAYKFFHIPVCFSDKAETGLNEFLARHVVQTVDRQFIAAGEHSAWSVCVVYDDGGAGKQSSRRTSSIDYRELLDPSDFDVYSELRRLRKSLAEQQAVPTYTVFTNEQLASMVRRRARTLTDLRAIDGIGQSRCERYGQQFLALLCSLQAESSGDPEREQTPGGGTPE